jgi:hypothetical protein
MADTRPVECRFFDADDKLVGKVSLPPRTPGAPLRKIVLDSKTFIEGDGTGFYGENEFAEQVEHSQEVMSA